MCSEFFVRSLIAGRNYGLLAVYSRAWGTPSLPTAIRNEAESCHHRSPNDSSNTLGSSKKRIEEPWKGQFSWWISKDNSPPEIGHSLLTEWAKTSKRRGWRHHNGVTYSQGSFLSDGRKWGKGPWEQGWRELPLRLLSDTRFLGLN